MKKNHLLGILMAAAGILSAAPQEGARNEKPFYGSERPARNIVIGKKILQTLRPGTSDVEIVVAPDAFLTTKYAADALQTYLNRRLNAGVPIVNSPDPAKTSLILGINKWSKKAGIDERKLCRDAFIIKTAGKDVYILGRDDAKADLKKSDKRGGAWGTLNEHATLFGVYDFLERFGGVRFYFPNELGIYMPENKIMEIPEIDIFDRPDFEVRNVSIYSGQWEDEKKKVNPLAASVSPQKNIYSKMLRLQTKYIPNCHGLRALQLDVRFGKSHPEYFALRSDGRRYCDPSMRFCPQLCYSGKVMDVIAEDALAILRDQPPASRGLTGKAWGPTQHLPGVVFGMMPEDAYQYCLCEACRKEFVTLQSTSNFMWKKTAEIADRIKKELGRGYVSQMAYYPYHLVPETDIPDNVLVMVAAKGPWMIAQPQLLDNENKRILAWNRKISGKTWLWNYAGKLKGLNLPGIPSTSPRSVAKYYQSHKDNIYGAYMESETDKLIYNYLTYYLFSKVAWDNNADADAILKEHYLLMFGKAAPVMETIFDEIENKWVYQICGQPIDTTRGPERIALSEYEVWTKVYTKQHIAQMVSQFDKAEKLTANEPDARRRVRYIRKEFLDPVIAASAKYLERNNTLGSFRVGLPAVLYLQPFQGKNPELLKTSVKVSSDSEFLNLVFDCEEPETENMVALKRKLDDPDTWKDNSVEIFLDPSGKRKGFYQIIINSRGALTDQYCTALGSSTQCDSTWNSGAKIEVETYSKGWKAVIRIPLRSFREPLNPKGFLANFTRNRVLNNEQQYYTWSPFLSRNFHESKNFGTLVPEPEKNANILNTSDFNTERKKHKIGSWILPACLPQGVSVTLDRSTFLFGPQSLKISNTNVQDKFVFAVTQTALKIKPNTKYRISYFVRLENIVPLDDSRGGVCIIVMNTKNYWFPQSKLIGTLPWLKQSFEFTSAPETNPKRTYIKPAMVQCTGTVWFDGITLEEIP
ncbi:MAG: DUF4838 domain-containing protein [Victivallales bacterium]